MNIDVNIIIEYAVEQKENAEQSIERLKELYGEGEKLGINTPDSVAVQLKMIQCQKDAVSFWSNKIEELRKVADNNG